MTESTTDSPMRSVRIPGEFGPILRCFGELDCDTAEALSQELAFLESLDHLALTLNLAGCYLVSPEAIRAIYSSFWRLRERGNHLVVVVNPGRVASMLEGARFDQIVPVFRSEEAAVRGFRAGLSPPPSTPWVEARAETMAHWTFIRELLGNGSLNGALRLLTSMMPLCERSESAFGSGQARVVARCEFCPLFHHLGAERTDFGCAGLLDPIIAAVRARDIDTAESQVMAAVGILSRMPLPEECGTVKYR